MFSDSSFLCKVCNSISHKAWSSTIRSHYITSLYICKNCSFSFYSPVKWLEDAYNSPINPSDVGYVWRNVHFSNTLRKIIRPSFRSEDFYVDYGAGYGLLVRLMRDNGFRFHWHDPHCNNLFATHTVADPDQYSYRIVTAFEVFEHFIDPIKSLKEMLRFGNTIVFSTSLIPNPIPNSDAWDYYGLEHGQHVSFWNEASLTKLAECFNLIYTRLNWIGADWHLISQINEPLRKRTSYLQFLRYFNMHNPSSLMLSDYRKTIQYEQRRLSKDYRCDCFHLDQ